MLKENEVKFMNFPQKEFIKEIRPSNYLIQNVDNYNFLIHRELPEGEAVGLWHEYKDSPIPITKIMIDFYLTALIFFGKGILLASPYFRSKIRYKTILLVFLLSPFLAYVIWALVEGSPWSKWFYIISLCAMVGIYTAKKWHSPFSEGEIT